MSAGEVEPSVSEILELTTDIVTAYVSNNEVDASGLPELIDTVFHKMLGLAQAELPKPDRFIPEPAVPIEQSVTDEVIFSLEDGQPYKSLKRHLKARYGMTPEAYREKWGLPVDYPMVAPAYARERSKLAKKSGLGRG